MTGTLIGIARKSARRAVVETLERGRIDVETGLEGDHRGAKLEARRVTVMAREDWEAALADLPADVPPEARALPWTTRRANLLVEGVRLPRAKGGVFAVGPVALEITDQCAPCSRMEEAQRGLLRALAPDWRGGVLCRVLEGGSLALGDAVEVRHAPEERARVLPG